MPWERDIIMMKKQLIMEKALELFSEQGFEATSVQQITERCGISKGAFYLSFKTKDELIFYMIDFYMQQFTAEVDLVVRGVENKQDLLFEFYKSIFKRFNEHSHAARIFMKEQALTPNKELFNKVHSYEKILIQSIIYMLEELYGEDLRENKYDLVYCIRGFMMSYSELFLFHDLPLNLDEVAYSLAEKTNILARYTTIPCITKELAQIVENPFNQTISVEKLHEVLDQTICGLEKSIERESLEILKEQIDHQTLSKAIIKGLIENVRHLENYKWTAYVLIKYFDL